MRYRILFEQRTFLGSIWKWNLTFKTLARVENLKGEKTKVKTEKLGHNEVLKVIHADDKIRPVRTMHSDTI